jgi:hypothetical protein
LKTRLAFLSGVLLPGLFGNVTGGSNYIYAYLETTLK